MKANVCAFCVKYMTRSIKYEAALVKVNNMVFHHNSNSAQLLACAVNDGDIVEVNHNRINMGVTEVKGFLLCADCLQKNWTALGGIDIR